MTQHHQRSEFISVNFVDMAYKLRKLRSNIRYDVCLPVEKNKIQYMMAAATLVNLQVKYNVSA